MERCKWVNLNNPIYVQYHDNEWGTKVEDDDKLFELLLLESFQAGLSWECILNKREAFRQAFDNFDYKIISCYGERKVQELMQNKEIIRNRRKIEASIHNALVFMDIQQEWGSFYKYIWHFTDGEIVKNHNDAIPVCSNLSDKISNDLKKRGMKFVGTIIIYSYLQAIGVIDDHELNCFKY